MFKNKNCIFVIILVMTLYVSNIPLAHGFTLRNGETTTGSTGQSKKNDKESKEEEEEEEEEDKEKDNKQNEKENNEEQNEEQNEEEDKEKDNKQNEKENNEEQNEKENENDNLNISNIINNENSLDNVENPQMIRMFRSSTNNNNNDNLLNSDNQTQSGINNAVENNIINNSKIKPKINNLYSNSIIMNNMNTIQNNIAYTSFYDIDTNKSLTVFTGNKNGFFNIKNSKTLLKDNFTSFMVNYGTNVLNDDFIKNDLSFVFGYSYDDVNNFKISGKKYRTKQHYTFVGILNKFTMYENINLDLLVNFGNSRYDIKNVHLNKKNINLFGIAFNTDYKIYSFNNFSVNPGIYTLYTKIFNKKSHIFNLTPNILFSLNILNDLDINFNVRYSGKYCHLEDNNKSKNNSNFGYNLGFKKHFSDDLKMIAGFDTNSKNISRINYKFNVIYNF